MGEHQPAQTPAIRRGTRHCDKRLALIEPLLINVEDVPVVAPSLQPADDPRGETVFRAGWIKMSAPSSPCKTRTAEMSTLAVCKSLIAASAACLSGSSAASSLTGRWRNSSTLVIGPSVILLQRPSVPRHSRPAQISSEPGFHRLSQAQPSHSESHGGVSTSRRLSG